jgi:hypothetical protein
VKIPNLESSFGVTKLFDTLLSGLEAYQIQMKIKLKFRKTQNTFDRSQTELIAVAARTHLLAMSVRKVGDRFAIPKLTTVRPILLRGLTPAASKPLPILKN